LKIIISSYRPVRRWWWCRR